MSTDLEEGQQTIALSVVIAGHQTGVELALIRGALVVLNGNLKGHASGLE